MIDKLLTWLRGLISREPVHLAVVRRYADANGHYVGELYKYDTFAGVGCYRLVGCSLDSLPLDMGSLSLGDEPQTLDLEHDFLAALEPNRLRVGAAEPKDNPFVIAMIRRIPCKNIRLVIQNKFIEYVMEPKKV
jgi:hypothetical protein